MHRGSWFGNLHVHYTLSLHLYSNLHANVVHVPARQCLRSPWSALFAPILSGQSYPWHHRFQAFLLLHRALVQSIPIYTSFTREWSPPITVSHSRTNPSTVWIIAKASKWSPCSKVRHNLCIGSLVCRSEHEAPMHIPTPLKHIPFACPLG